LNLLKVIMAGWMFGEGAYALEFSVSAGLEIMLAAVLMAII
jgi:hypothetical protein